MLKKILCLLGFHEFTKWSPTINAKWDVRYCKRKGCLVIQKRRVV